MGSSKEIEEDLEAIRAMAHVLKETGLTEIEIERGQARLRVAKTATTVAAQMAAPAAMPAAVPESGGASPAPAAEPDPANHPGAVTSPMVGTAYLSPSPEANPFVSEGASVKQGDTLMIVEAMKTMNEIKSPRSGTVKKILAADAEPVQFGDVLMIVE